MGRANHVKQAILKVVGRSERRSSLFWWLVDHHDDVLEWSAGRRIDWLSFCREAAANGLTDTKGLPPTVRNARATWVQARKEVARVRAALAAAPPKRLMPSRLPKDWRPEVVTARQPAVVGGSKQPLVPATPTPPSERPRTLPPPPRPVYDTPPPAPVFESNRTYERRWIPDEELDLSLAPETIVNEKGEVEPMNLEARRNLARALMDLNNDSEEMFRFGPG